MLSRFPVRRLLTAIAMLGILAGCSTMGGATGQADDRPVTAPTDRPTAAPTTTVPTGSPAPARRSPDTAPVATAEQALAAVIEELPRFEGYPLRPAPEPEGSPGPIYGGGLIGQSRWVIAREVAAGFELTFVTGSGDCPSGCIEHAYETYLVEADGAVALICSETDVPGAAPSVAAGRESGLSFEPCADVPR